MNKNEVISRAIAALLNQRETFVFELKDVNLNDSMGSQRQMMIENAIYNVDMKIDNLIDRMELTPPSDG